MSEVQLKDPDRLDRVTVLLHLGRVKSAWKIWRRIHEGVLSEVMVFRWETLCLEHGCDSRWWECQECDSDG